ncbi:MAG: beta-galactosidase [Victivallales bacterium]|nr:beta-galactosidase [Victivallales bacterium]
MKLWQWELRLCVGMALLCVVVCGGGLPEFSELRKETLFPQGGRVTVSPEGHFLVNGVARYMAGSLLYEGVPSSWGQKTDGYPEELSWLYEKPHGYETHQRVGFDATGMSTSNAWIEAYRPGMKRSFAAMGEDVLRAAIDSGLPLYVDFTAAHWHHGQLKYVEGMHPGKGAFTEPGKGYHHWMFYNPNHPEGMRLYEDMWRHGVQYVLSLGAKPLIYELFNEPGLNDVSASSRAVFVERLRKKYGNIQALNAAWRTNYMDFASVGGFRNEMENAALAVEWIKFMEDSFVEAVRHGVQTVRKHDPRPEVLICVQPAKGNLSNVNQYEVNRQLNAVCACTGGGNGVNVREYLSMAEGGKPVFDGETYMGHTAQSMRRSLVKQFARGLNASFVFKWSRRAWDPLWKQENGGRKLADKFPWLLLNPYCVKAEELNGIRQAKEEILLVSHLFAPRNRGISPRVAVLYSQPTRRLARATGVLSYHLYDDYAMALERLALPYDIVYEEQLAERSGRYDVIFAAGVTCVGEGARHELESYVRHGGTLVFVQEALQFNEYGFAQEASLFPGIVPGESRVSEAESLQLSGKTWRASVVRAPVFHEEAAWKVVCGGKAPALWHRTLGAGGMLYLGCQLPEESVADFVLWCLEGKTARPVCQLRNEETGVRSLDIETAAALRGEERGYIFLNKSLGSKCIRFQPDVPCQAWGIPGEKLRLTPDADGSLVLLLKKDDAVILTGGTENALRRYEWKETRTIAESKRQALAFLQTERAAVKTQNKAFLCQMDAMKMLDLRDVANSCYTDKVGGDGQGGWTDQGENCLRNVPWEVTDCNGVPIDFIRPDMNHGRSCIVLGSRKLLHGAREVRGIPVHEKADRLFFLQGYAWGRGGEEAFRYIVRYANGMQVEIPIICDLAAGDWYRMGDRIASPVLVPGWVNGERRGLWLFAWKNPHPTLEIASLDIVSAWNDAIGLIGGITVERPDQSWMMPLAYSEARGWGGAKLTWNEKEGSLAVAISPKCQDWAGCFIPMSETLDCTKLAGRTLIFELNGLPDEWGKHQGGQQGQAGVKFMKPDGNTLANPKHSWNIIVDDDPVSWQEVRIPLEAIIPANLPQGCYINGVNLQYWRMRDYKSGVAIRHVRLTP